MRCELLPGLRRVAARVALIVACLGLGVGRPAPGYGQTAPDAEYLIKAAYLYHFAMFIDWPADAFASATAPITIGVVGPDPFGQALDATVRDKRVNGRAFTVKRLQWTDDLRQTQILFIAASEAGRIGELARRLDGRPVLIVGESPDLARRGALISFRIDDGRVRFDINVDEARRARLSISSKLLNVARIVRGAP